ncbi:MAG: polysaccharide biosynthesis/export family protein [Pseudomonadales bacterium]|nr:polysaccharide biosynthesis/export family protein [Pseudomonadales bacterium]MCP5185881.1 polysaccharide biosynthesis/export family protein [Pseudomonadales bacterium]
MLLAGSGLSQAVETAADFTIDSYRIQPEDVLDVFVWKEEELQKKVTVRPDGGISLPLVGNVEAMGKTIAELQTNITTALREYIPDAVVTVSIAELKGMRIYVSGKVSRPGEYEIGRYIDVLQALTLAGGPNAFADVDKILIQRRSGDRVEVFKFNYSQVQKGKHLEQNIMLKPNDVVMVP